MLSDEIRECCALLREIERKAEPGPWSASTTKYIAASEPNRRLIVAASNTLVAQIEVMEAIGLVVANKLMRHGFECSISTVGAALARTFPDEFKPPGCNCGHDGLAAAAEAWCASVREATKQ